MKSLGADSPRVQTLGWEFACRKCVRKCLLGHTCVGVMGLHRGSQ